MTTNVLDAIREKLATDQTTAETAWTGLVKRLAADETVSEREILAALKNCGRTVTDLESAIGWETHILRLREVLKEWPAVEKAAQLAASAASEFHLRRQAHERAMRDECQQVTIAEQFAATEVQRIVSAKNELSELLNEPVMLPGITLTEIAEAAA